MIDVACRCGTVRGSVAKATRWGVNRVICYCDDCQAFAHHLNRPDLLDPQGGSDIVQVAPASLSFVEGTQEIAGVRLTPKGIYRWFAGCCQTHLGNTVSPAIPFVGVMTEAFETGGQTADELFGKPVAAIRGEYAIGEMPEGSRGISMSLMARTMAKVLNWKVTGQSWPNPFFEKGGTAPIYPVTSLDPEERESLRELCSPNPSRSKSSDRE